jgi:hypothetical protein
MNEAKTMRNRALLCLRLARDSTDREVAAKLRALAADYQAKAMALEARQADTA